MEVSGVVLERIQAPEEAESSRVRRLIKKNRVNVVTITFLSHSEGLRD